MASDPDSRDTAWNKQRCTHLGTVSPASGAGGARDDVGGQCAEKCLVGAVRGSPTKSAGLAVAAPLLLSTNQYPDTPLGPHSKS